MVALFQDKNYCYMSVMLGNPAAKADQRKLASNCWLTKARNIKQTARVKLEAELDGLNEAFTVMQHVINEGISAISNE